MSEPKRDPSSLLPPDPTFSPQSYISVSRILRGGVVVFVVLATVGMILSLLIHPGETLANVLGQNASFGPARFGEFLGQLAVGSPGAIISLGIVAMITVVVARVLFVAVHAFRGHEHPLAYVATIVVTLLLVGLFVLGPLVG